MVSVRTLIAAILAMATLFPGRVTARGPRRPRYTVPQFAEAPFAPDGGHFVEGTRVAKPLSLHGRLSTKYLYGVGLADRASQFTGNLSLGLGIIQRLQLALSLPFGWTLGALSEDPGPDGTRYLVGMKEDGPGIGDLTTALLLSAYDSSDGGFGLLFGLALGAPTGNNRRLLGEGGVTAEPFAVAAFQLFGTRLSFNLSYRFRPEHVQTIGNRRFEQDDDLRWRIGLRIPKKYDVTWSVEAEGALGMVTKEGPWPSASSRPVGLAVGVDFPLARELRLGLLVGGGLVGESIPTVTIGMHVSFQPTLSDDDGDGLAGFKDACPLLKEDLDGFEDKDGCPDLDNDKDGFPDDEDRCPQKPGDDFSEDGC